MNKIKAFQVHHRKFSLWIFSFTLTLALQGCSEPLLRKSGDRVNDLSVRERPYVVLVSIDGYRYDYTDRFSPPALSQLRTEGASALGLLPVYPSKTFTNHLSIITGLYAENHGIVANAFFDPERNQTYRISDQPLVADGTWYHGTPLWVSAEKQGMLTATFFWPSSSAEIQGIRPSYYSYRYDSHVPLADQVKQVKAWLSLPEERRPHFVTLYFEDVDTAGHNFGPDSPQVREAVLKVDHAIGMLRKEIQALPLPVNLIVVSDHGMQAVDSKKVEYLDDYTDLSSAKVVGDGPQVLIYTQNTEQRDRIYQDLKAKAKHFEVYVREKMPESFHYSHTPRAGDLVVMSRAPYSVGVRGFKVKGGNHGFDPDRTLTMRGIFYAQGPQIHKKQGIKPFRNIHIFPMISHILGLKTLSPIDGKEEVLKELYE